MKLRTVLAKSEKEYPIYIGEQLLERADFKKNKLVVIMDSHVAKIYKDFFVNILRFNLADFLIVPAGESSKTREMKQLLEDKLLAKDLGRDIVILAVGGGMICDLAGFLAATYCRGVPAIYWPTSLLAMVDASIGGKTAVNTPFGKNLIGAFSTPFAVWIDIDFLKTLSKKEFANGMVEVIKHAAICDSNLFEKLNRNHRRINECQKNDMMDMIEASCQIKNEIVSQDAKDLGIRSILNFGHTIGHAIEKLENYKIKHGEAVAMGMIIEAYISYLKGRTDLDVIDRLHALLKLYHIPFKTNVLEQPEAIIKALYLDKKNKQEKIHMILIQDIGSVYIEEGFYTHPIEETKILKALTWAQGYF
jgi:3-dehydroquinate synthase